MGNRRYLKIISVVLSLLIFTGIQINIKTVEALNTSIAAADYSYTEALSAVESMEKNPIGSNIDKAYNAVIALKAGAEKDALYKRVEAVAGPHHKAVYDLMEDTRINKELKTIGDARTAVAGMAKIFIKDAYTWSAELDTFTIQYQKTVVDTLNAIANGKKEVKQATINDLKEIIFGLELQRSNKGLLKLVLDYSATLDKIQMDYVNEVLSEVKAAKTTEELNVAKVKYNDLLTMKDETLKGAVIANIGAAIKNKEGQLSNGELKVHYIDVGQADSILIEANGEAMLIDAGNNEDSDLVINYIKSKGITNLKYVIGTHPHEDHIGGLDAVINTFNIGKVIMPQVTTTTQTFKDVTTAIKNKGLSITTPKVGDNYQLGNANFTILAPNGSNYTDLNDYSIVTKLKYGNKSFIFTGDAEALSEGEILAKQLDISADVLKIGHHGSDYSTSQAFLDKVNPKYAVISVGEGNIYGHPTDVVLNRLANKNINVYRTDKQGTIIATSNGTNITFNTVPVDNIPSVGENTPMWIASKIGTVYHSSKECSNMSSPIQITLKEARERGLKPCSKCNPPR